MQLGSEPDSEVVVNEKGDEKCRAPVGFFPDCDVMLCYAMQNLAVDQGMWDGCLDIHDPP